MWGFVLSNVLVSKNWKEWDLNPQPYACKAYTLPIKLSSLLL